MELTFNTIITSYRKFENTSSMHLVKLFENDNLQCYVELISRETSELEMERRRKVIEETQRFNENRFSAIFSFHILHQEVLHIARCLPAFETYFSEGPWNIVQCNTVKYTGGSCWPRYKN